MYGARAASSLMTGSSATRKQLVLIPLGRCSAPALSRIFLDLAANCSFEAFSNSLSSKKTTRTVGRSSGPLF